MSFARKFPAHITERLKSKNKTPAAQKPPGFKFSEARNGIRKLPAGTEQIQ